MNVMHDSKKGMTHLLLLPILVLILIVGAFVILKLKPKQTGIPVSTFSPSSVPVPLATPNYNEAPIPLSSGDNPSNPQGLTDIYVFSNGNPQKLISVPGYLNGEASVDPNGYLYLPQAGEVKKISLATGDISSFYKRDMTYPSDTYIYTSVKDGYVHISQENITEKGVQGLYLSSFALDSGTKVLDTPVLPPVGYGVVTYQGKVDDQYVVTDSGGDGCGGGGYVYWGSKKISDIGSGCNYSPRYVGLLGDKVLLVGTKDNTFENPHTLFTDLYTLNVRTGEKEVLDDFSKNTELADAFELFSTSHILLAVSDYKGWSVYSLQEKKIINKIPVKGDMWPLTVIDNKLIDVEKNGNTRIYQIRLINPVTGETTSLSPIVIPEIVNFESSYAHVAGSYKGNPVILLTRP